MNPTATTAAISTAEAPIAIWTLGRVKCADPRRPGRNRKMTTRPTVAPIAKPPARNASSCSVGLGLFSISTVMPIRNGSMLTAMAITRSVIHIPPRCPDGRTAAA